MRVIYQSLIAKPWLLATLLLGLLSGCGQTGPLYLPEKAHETNSAGSDKSRSKSSQTKQQQPKSRDADIEASEIETHNNTPTQ